MSKSNLEKQFEALLVQERINEDYLNGVWEVEYKFHPKRRWRFDFAFPLIKIAVEIEGGVWSGGRHTRGAGFIKDMEKYNAAVLLGWRVLRYSGETMTQAIEDLKKLL